MNPRVQNAKAIDNYSIQIQFTNGEYGIFDIIEYLNIGIFQELQKLYIFLMPLKLLMDDSMDKWGGFMPGYSIYRFKKDMIPFHFIGKENDIESGFGDFSLGKYNYTSSSSLSIDYYHSRGWEKYLAWSPFSKIYLFLYRLSNNKI